MSSDSTYPGRASRRAGNEPPPRKRASVGAAVAVLITAAIIGFGGGAIAANAGDNEEPSTADPTDSTSDPPAEPTDEAGDEPTLTLSSPQDGAEVASGEEGQIDLEGAIDPPAGGVTLTVERSFDGDTWEPFGSSGPQTTETGDDGAYSYNLWSGRDGDNYFRMVGEGLESNPIVVTVVSEDDD